MKTEDNKKISLEVTALVEKAREGNHASFQKLVHIFQDDIYRLAYYRTFSQMDAEDITQDVFELAYRKMGNLNDTQKFRPWLYSIAVNRCNDFLRKRKYRALLLRSAQEEELIARETDISNNSNDNIDKQKFWQQVKAMLHKLSYMEREVFTLRFMEHRNINEIATILRKNESTVKTHLYRALNKARENSDFFKEYRESIL